MTSLDITQQRLLNQHVAAAPFEKPGDAVSWLVAVQSQDYFGAKWALGLRLQDAHDADLDRAFNDGSILRTHMLRPTWHFATPADIRWLLALTGPRVHAANASMYRKLELDNATLKRSHKAFAGALQGGQQLTREELRAALEQSRQQAAEHVGALLPKIEACAACRVLQESEQEQMRQLLAHCCTPSLARPSA